VIHALRFRSFDVRMLILLLLLLLSTGSAVAVPPDNYWMAAGNNMQSLVDSTGDRSGGEPVQAGMFASSNVTLRAWLSPTEIDPSLTYTCPIECPTADIWGYTSPANRQYAIVGFLTGTAFVEITDPDNPVVVDFVPGGGTSATWRDMKTLDHYCYVVKDGVGIGMQVLDMSDIDNGNVTLVNTVTWGSPGIAHNIAINAESEFAYLIGANIANQEQLASIDLTDRENPQFAGGWGSTRGHDALVVNWTEGEYAGSEIAFVFSYDEGMHIVDVTDKANMETISTLVYPNVDICHQGWLSDDRRYMFIGDEGDEFGGLFTTTYVADLIDLDNPALVTTFTNGLPSTDHNMMVKGDFLYQANYSSGLRVWDVSDVMNATEVGWFDTYPENNFVGFDGAWAPYTDFPNNIVIVSDRSRGLFVLDVSDAVESQPPPAPPLAEAHFAGACDVAADCEALGAGTEGVCVPGQDTCYVPKNRILSLEANPANDGILTARRISLAPDALGGEPVVLGWVSDNQVAGGTFNPAPHTMSASPIYRDWSDLDGGDTHTVHVTGCPISPGHTYLIQSIRQGANLGDEASYSAPLTLSTVSTWGDVIGPPIQSTPTTIASGPSGITNLEDVLGAILVLEQTPTAPANWFDLEGAGTQALDNFTSLADALTVLVAIETGMYPFPAPLTCP